MVFSVLFGLLFFWVHFGGLARLVGNWIRREPLADPALHDGSFFCGSGRHRFLGEKGWINLAVGRVKAAIRRFRRLTIYYAVGPSSFPVDIIVYSFLNVFLKEDLPCSRR